MNIYQAQKVLSHKSPIDVRVFRFMYRVFCWHEYIEHLAESKTLIGPTIIKQCGKCGHRKYKSMDGT